ncbi:MAG: hypothetical protein AAGA75_25845 [Cyanobacteria bacterium P01_E01_bin.6]
MVTVLIALFLIGLSLSLTGGVIGIVQAFQTSAVWGLLYLFVPFASLVFVVKFWNRKWVRNSLFLALGGVVSFIAAAFVSPAALKQAGYGDVYTGNSDWGESDWEDRTWVEDSFEDDGAWDDGSSEAADSQLADSQLADSQLADSQLIEGTSATQAQMDAYFQSAFDRAMEAAEMTQTASTSQDWTLVANLWKDAIAILDSIPESDPNHATAEAKAEEYRSNLTYAQSNIAP